MIAQSYYYTLFKTGRWNHPDWLHYAAFDHPPLPKYCFGLSLDLAGLPTPASIEPWQNWMRGDFSPPSDPRVLYWARVPSALFGVGGAIAVYFVGLQLHSRLVGTVASLLCVLDPLYLTHARRAMSDSFCECMVIVSVALAIWGCKLVWEPHVQPRRWLALVLLSSVSCGLAALAKLNGGIATVVTLGILVSSCLLRIMRWLTSRGAGYRAPNPLVPLVAAAAIGLCSFLVFVVLNPFMTAQPTLPERASSDSKNLARMGILTRALFLVQFRRGWTVDALNNPAFEKDWLLTSMDRLRMTLWEGFGRFSPLGPRDILTVEPRPDHERFSDYDRASSLLWFPLVLGGMVLCVQIGWVQFRSGAAPVAWSVLVYFFVVLCMVVGMIPLNWDRYYLPIQAPAALLVALLAARIKEWVGRRNLM